jgi:hypothetical protein
MFDLDEIGKSMLLFDSFLNLHSLLGLEPTGVYVGIELLHLVIINKRVVSFLMVVILSSHGNFFFNFARRE